MPEGYAWIQGIADECLMDIRDDIKSYGKFAIFTRLKIGGGWV